METTNATTQEQVSVQVENSNVSTFQTAIKSLIANGAKKVNNLKIKNVNYSEKDNYTMVSFTLTTPIRGYVSNDNGNTFEEGMTNTLFTSLYAIVGAMKEDEELAWMGNVLLEQPKVLNLILNGSSIDIIQQDIPTGIEFTNPFSTRSDSSSQVYDHDIIVNHLIKFKLGKTGEKMADKLADKLMDF